MVDYRVLSVQTDSFIVQTGFERPGQLVMTRPGNPGPPFHRHLTFSAPVSPGRVSIVTVKEWNGLYIGLNKRMGRLVWTTEAFEWLVAPTGPYYRFYPKDGDDLYWYQNQEIEPQVGATAGRNLVDQEPLFEVQPVDD